MLTVWTVCIGTKYTAADVRIVKNMVARHLNAPHRFRCLADREIEGIDTFIPDEQWPGWWSKLLLFRYASGQCLYLDLDVVVTGNLDRLLSWKLSMPANWGIRDRGWCQSSVMSWAGDYSVLADAFDPAELHPPSNGDCGAYGKARLYGDQELINSVLGKPGGDNIGVMRNVYSYKWHCRNGLPADASVVAFHGEPKPGAVSDPWVAEARSFMSTAR